MTNYTRFPHWRKYGIVMKFNEEQYSWCDNTKANRKYLIESEYCSNGVEFYVWENNTTYTQLETFKKFLNERQDAPDDGVCPLCAGKLVVKHNRINGQSFLGCSNYPNCEFTKNA